ncbi:flavin monoamine oxidase family protein [Promicromonospora iranensis]|uniref:Monoamine oxidase n=1 Tax=Promicromonospora iranensis TaxID=1105144 RepID=A0ABU2CHB2_9MICO|nr:NAD(P)/FAD-dependent oxidoreductase [Promicromonospora iranensis]MDR7380725.1 monoamine oxidase [Promicromonospora iranensis]
MRTPLHAALRRVVRDLNAEAPGRRPTAGGLTRRQFIGGSLAVGAGLAGTAPAGAAEAVRGRRRPRIVVVGAGLAGLTAAYRLTQAGYRPIVYEAADRIGGRCWSNRRWRGGQVSEHGGELIDTGHTEILDLVEELGLDVENRVEATPPGTEPFYFFDGSPYLVDDVRDDLREILPQARRDAEAAGFPITYDSHTPRARELDLMSIRQWIEAYVPGGPSSRLGRLLDVAYTIEYGAEIERQSALNLINLFGYSTAEDPQLFGESDEVFHVAGGNDRIVARLADALTDRIVTGTALTAVTALSRGDRGRYAVSLTSRGRTTTEVADLLLLALPFSLLRRVDLRDAGFPALKRTAIEDLPMGANTKLALQFDRRAWQEAGCDGDTFADTGYQATWDTTLGQPGETGILTNFTGGRVALDFAGDPPARYARRFLAQLSPVLPGVPPRWTGAVALDYWPCYRWTRGSYSYYGVGQYTAFAGVEGEPVGTCYFAGEHTSIESQGYLNGAVESGERAAREMLDALGGPGRAPAGPGSA